MANIFLDTNVFIDAIHRKPGQDILYLLENHILHISPLSVHIYCYSYKIKIPNEIVAEQTEKFQIIEFSYVIMNKALSGPTSDFEDNIQLHSAVENDCELFLTLDKKLLNMRFFGKTQIISPENLN